MRCVFPLLRATLPKLFASTESLVEVDSNNSSYRPQRLAHWHATLRSHDGCPD